ncbi:MAG: hypothetical protein IT285_02095 [Bdellovibrionales bacterium]|nr:hypothetical protein [Bdellovibrionales bacterium]
MMQLNGKVSCLLARVAAFLAAVTFTLSLSAPQAQAEDVYEFVVRKQEKKQKSKWSLADWLDTRDRMRMMDLWLAMNSPSPYEFHLGGDYAFVTPVGGSQVSGINGQFGAFASIFGLQLDYSNVEDAAYWQALFQLRVFGFQAQGTNITLQGGLRSHLSGPAEGARSPMFGVTTNFYLARYFGLEGLFQHRYTSTPNNSSSRYGGQDWGAGAFIDFKFLRLYGGYKWITDFTYTGGAEAQRSSTQLHFGARLYF